MEATGAQGAARNVGRALCARAVQRTINPSNRNRAREREWGESKGISGQIWGLYDDFLAKFAEMAYNTRGDAKQPFEMAVSNGGDGGGKLASAPNGGELGI